MNAKITAKMGAIAALAAALGIFIAAGCDTLLDAIDPEPPKPVQGETIKIGLIFPADPSYPARAFLRGAWIALNEINDSGGILGKQVELIVRDNLGTDPYPTAASTIDAARDLIMNEGVTAIVGPVFSTNSIALGQALTQAGETTPFIPASTSPIVTQSYTHTALVSANVPLHSTILSDFARSGLKANTAAILGQEGDAYSQLLTSTFMELFEADGGTVVSAETYAVETVDFSANVETLLAGGSDVCFLTSFPPEVPLIIDQARAAGYEGIFIGANGWDVQAAFYSVLDDNSVLDGSYFTTDFSPDNPFISPWPPAVPPQFAAAYEASYGVPADSLAGNGFDAMSVLAQAIQTAGANGAELTDDAIMEALTAIRGYRGATEISHFDENRLAVKDLIIMRIQDGASAIHDLWDNPLKGSEPPPSD